MRGNPGPGPSSSATGDSTLPPHAADFLPPGLLVLYASATGTAEEQAKGFSREARAKGLRAECASVRDVDAAADWLGAAGASALVMFVATAGDGDPPEDFVPLFEALGGTRSPGGDSTAARLQGLPFAVFALGDSSYVRYNKAGLDTDTRLAALGARRLAAVGMGNAKEDMESALDAWKEELWEPLAEALGVALECGKIAPELIFSYVVPPPGAAPPLPFAPPPSLLEPSTKHPHFATLVEKRELLLLSGGATGDEQQEEEDDRERRSTLHLELDIGAASVTYQAGDHCGLLPANDPQLVQEYLCALELRDATMPEAWAAKLQAAESGGRHREEGEELAVTVAAAARELRVELCTRVRQRARASLLNTLPARVSLFDALTWYYDLAGRPRKSTLRALAQYCRDPAEFAEFRQLLSREATGKYNALLADVRTVVGVLRCFPSCRPPVAHFLEVMPRTVPRFYSIASDTLAHKGKIHLTVAVKSGGLCSGFLNQRAQVGSLIPLFVRKSTFHLPLHRKDRPLILIGAGTGIAPLRGFCFRRRAWAGRKQKLGPCTLFFGCRHRGHDDLYAEELVEFVREGVLSGVELALSRDGPVKEYVQHRLRARAADVMACIRGGGSIFVCGDKEGMSVGVEAALAEIIAAAADDDEGMSVAAARVELQRLAKAGRYLKDVW